MWLLCEGYGASLYVAIAALARSVARSAVIGVKKSKPNVCAEFANIKKCCTFVQIIYNTHKHLIIMKRLFALLFSVAIFAVGCEGGFDISGLLKDYLPDPVKSEAVLDVDEDGNYIVSPEGGSLNIDLSTVKKYLDIDLVSQFVITISEEGQEWIHVSSLDDLTEGNLVVVVDENTTEEKRYADIVLRPAENDFLNYTVSLVQMPAGYVHEETPEAPSEDETVEE